MTWEQTAAALAREVDRLQKENDRLRDGIQEGVKRLAFIPYFSTLHLIFDSAKRAQTDLESLISPAAIQIAEGDPNAGNKPLEIVIENIDIGGFDVEQWKRAMRNLPTMIVPSSANGGESQALQAAILGLHTLAGEFPTPTWKTREDYLQATISEINEILGKQ